MRISRPPPPPPPPRPNSAFGPYVLLERVAVGGMAEVFRASEQRAAGESRTVIIKRMLPQLAEDPSTRWMFEEEARLGSAVQHPNVVQVLSSGEVDGAPYLALEHVPGVDLWRFTRWLTREGRVLDQALAVHLTSEILLALDAVHSARDESGHALGIVHRDVSPSNVLLSFLGDVKLSDFGIAQSLLRVSYPQVAMATRGKLGYLSPEQVAGLASDRRSDVFAAAVIGAELLLGRPLFTGASELAVLLAIRDVDLAGLQCAGLPPKLLATLETALARDPEQRFSSAHDFRESLRAATESGDSWTLDIAALRAELAGLVAEAHRTRQTNAFEEHSDVEPPTGQTPDLVYHFRTPEGRTSGPLSYAKLIEAVATSEVGVRDVISLGGTPFRPLTDFPDLYRHLPISTQHEVTRPSDVAASADVAFDLADGGVARAFGTLLLQRSTGLLLCQQASVRKEVYLVAGVPEFVSSNLASELLGEYLVARGTISRGELDMALAVMPRFEGRLGDTLTALGLIDSISLFQQIAAQVQEKLMDLYLWTGGRAAFYEGISPPSTGFPLGLDGWRVLRDGLQRRTAAGVDALPAGTLRAVRPAPRGLVHAPLPSSCRRLLDQAEGAGFQIESGLSKEARADLTRDVAMLRALGAVTLDPPATR